ncbi:FAD-dependent oxidoreductase [Octadecabacter sp. G9-8]|uniref:FAD-dependent oxidoreductase n=1 Tax=Octadecabacter dasysiphoniae TaxID=2909341 RepID=A0ABS9CW70_9RHOB|nr:FAD-dependent oxidoreductase [Octadecabacter dasysiphoniae]MCF2871521.1 FAD-dependent oxidoreductase [Octadecabacter dasysiphoniae]
MADIVIVGGGLSGLALAQHLERAGADWHLLESRTRLGGRIKGVKDADHIFDLGPSWYWPGQPRMARLTADLGLATFKQHATGDLMFEPEQGDVQRGVGFASMEGSLRINGGMIALINGLAARLPENRITMNAQAATVDQHDGITLSDGTKITANRVVITCPPRVAAGLAFTPQIDINALSRIPTWMGGQAKFVATYDTPFWRTAGLSGDAMSRRGPLVEIHDASPSDTSLGALFGFVGVPPNHRAQNADAIIAASINQLARLFGDDDKTPRAAYLEDWATQPETASSEDQAPLTSHPAYGLPRALENLWDGALHFGSTETATDFGGFLEGALARAETLAHRLLA